MGEQVEIDVRDIVDALTGMLGRFANKRAAPEKANKDGIRVQIGEGSQQGKVRLTFKTEDYMDVEMVVDLRDMVRDHRQYLANMMRDFLAYLEEARAGRQERTRIVLNTPGLRVE